MSNDPPTSAPRELPRLLGPISAASIVVGNIIGSGIFKNPQKIAAALPSPGWILVCWVVAGFLALVGSFAFAEMGSRFPQAGGQYVFLRESFGRFPAFLFGWANLWIITSASIAALAFAAVEYMANVFHLEINPEGTPWSYKSIAIGLIALLTVANAVGVLWGARIQNVLTAMKLLALAAIIAGLFIPGKTHLGNLSPFWTIRGDAEGGKLLAAFKIAFLSIFWVYDGWYLLSFSAGEIKNPTRNLPLGFSIGMAVVIAVYLLANVSYLAAIPLDQMGTVEGVLGGVGAKAAELFYGPVGLILISVGVMGSTLGAANGNLLTGPRLFYAMAKDGLFFRRFAQVHPRFLTPFWAVIAQGVLSAICVLAGNFNDLTDSVVFAAWIFYGLTVAGIFVLRRREKESAPFRTPGYPWFPLVFVIFAVVFVLYTSWDTAGKVSQAIEIWKEKGKLSAEVMNGLYPLFTAGVILAGVPAYFWFRRGASSGDQQPRQ